MGARGLQPLSVGNNGLENGFCIDFWRPNKNIWLGSPLPADIATPVPKVGLIKHRIIREKAHIPREKTLRTNTPACIRVHAPATYVDLLESVKMERLVQLERRRKVVAILGVLDGLELRVGGNVRQTRLDLAHSRPYGKKQIVLA